MSDLLEIARRVASAARNGEQVEAYVVRSRDTEVEVFGGDAIITPEGKIYIIDINSWPSFARVRAEAAVQIARRLRLRLRQTAGRKG